MIPSVEERQVRKCYDFSLNQRCVNLIPEGWMCNIGIMDPDSREYDRFLTPCDYHLFAWELKELTCQHNENERSND